MTTPAPDPTAAGNGTSKRQPPARSAAKAAKAPKASTARRSTARGSRAPAAAKRQAGSAGDTATSATPTRSRRRATATAADHTAESVNGDLASSRPWHRPWPGRGRSVRGIYDRGRQRGAEQWSPLSRAASWLFARPELVLFALGSPPTVENDGRVLNRGVQAAVALLERLPRVEAEAFGPGADVAMARLRMRQSAGFLMPLRTDVYSAGRVIPGPDGAPPIPVRVYRRFGAFPMPPRPLPPAIVFFHGGGWVVGDVTAYERHCRMLAAVTRCTVVSVDYRLAPEHPFPAAVDDSLAAYQWVHRHTDELGIAPGQVAVMGDSAGGNLAAVVSLLTKPGGRGSAPDVPAPLVQGLVYPAVDARMGSDSHRTLSVGYILTRDGMDWFRGCYLPNDGDWLSPDASPLLADDHRGLPPAMVITAGFDPLRDEGAEYAEVLRAAGVPVTYRCYDDQVHGFTSMGIVPDTLALTIEVFDTMGRMVRAAADVAAASA